MKKPSNTPEVRQQLLREAVITGIITPAQNSYRDAFIRSLANAMTNYASPSWAASSVASIIRAAYEDYIFQTIVENTAFDAWTDGKISDLERDRAKRKAKSHLRDVSKRLKDMAERIDLKEEEIVNGMYDSVHEMLTTKVAKRIASITGEEDDQSQGQAAPSQS